MIHDTRSTFYNCHVSQMRKCVLCIIVLSGCILASGRNVTYCYAFFIHHVTIPLLVFFIQHCCFFWSVHIFEMPKRSVLYTILCTGSVHCKTWFIGNAFFILPCWINALEIVLYSTLNFQEGPTINIIIVIISKILLFFYQKIN